MKSQDQPTSTTKLDHEEQVIQKALIAGLVCAVVAGGLNPFDVTKIRLQNQMNNDYKGMLSGMKKIFREEGIRGLSKGLEPSILREITYSSIRIGGYEPIRRVLSYDNENPQYTSPFIKYLAALLCGSIGSALANPLDLIKTRFQALLPEQSLPYRNTLQALRIIFKTEGIKGLYRGWIVTCSRASVLNTAQLGSYDSIKHNFLMKIMDMEEGFMLHLWSSMSASIITTTAANPCKEMTRSLIKISFSLC